jgi:hypothetical protein
MQGAPVYSGRAGPHRRRAPAARAGPAARSAAAAAAAACYEEPPQTATEPLNASSAGPVM